MKKILFLSILILGVLGQSYAFGATAASVAAKKSIQTPQQTTTQSLPPAVELQYCNKIFKFDSQKLFYLTLSSISANRFTIDEIQSKCGYILFTAGSKQFLASVITIDAKNSMLKITPCDNNYAFQVGIVQNMIKYIELNSNTPVEKLNVS